MRNNNAEVIFRTRLSVDRRKVKDRRFYVRHEDFAHNSVVRGNNPDRRMPGDRRRMLFKVIQSFWKEAP